MNDGRRFKMNLTYSCGMIIALTLRCVDIAVGEEVQVEFLPTSPKPNSTDGNSSKVNINDEFISREDYLAKISELELRNMTELLIDECPDTNFCGYVMKDVWTSRYSCCIRCSCDVSCHEKESCCPHVMHKLARPNSTIEVANYTCEFAAIPNRNGKVFGEKFFFYTSCPADTDRQMKEACEKKADNATFAFEDVTPVTERITLSNYFNRHCAACHNVPVENQEFWTPRILCRNLPSVYDWSYLAKQDDCHITFDPPKGLDTNSTVCSVEIISECNVTGRWALYDRELESACQKFPLRYRLYTIDMPTKTYHNVFCAFCNGEYVQTDIAITSCEFSDINSLFSLLVSVSQPVIEPSQEHDDCDNGAIYDPILGQCQNLHCTKPLTLVPHKHTCTFLVEYISYTSFSIPFRVSLSGDALPLVSAEMVARLLLAPIYRLEDFKVAVYPVQFFFKLEHLYQQGPVLNSSASIKEAFLLVHITISDIPEPHSEFQKLVNAITNTKIKLNGTSVSISHGDLDGIIQTPQAVECRGFSSSMPSPHLQWIDQTISTVIVFEDPYDHMTNVGGIRDSLTDRECSTKSHFYDIDFLNCTAFMYDIDETGLKRVPAGLAFREKLFEFGKFQSVNESHVLVCVDTVKARFGTSRGSKKGACVTLYLLVFVKVFST